MTEHKQAAKTFALLLVFFTVVIIVFFYTAQKNIPHAKKEEPSPSAAVRAPILWGALAALTDVSKVTVVVGGVTVFAEVARSDAKKALGLSGRDPLPENEGMLFIFDRPGTLSFWNKDMRFPIDVIWMNDSAVIGVSEHLPLFAAGGVPVVITSPSAANAALEVPDGFVSKHAIPHTSNVVIYENK